MPEGARPEPPDDIEDRDPGLAEERTSLAWTRTAVSFAALGAAMLRTGSVAGVVVLLTAAVVWGLGRLSSRDIRGDGRPRRLSHRRTVQLVTISTASMSVLGLVVVLVSPTRAGG